MDGKCFALFLILYICSLIQNTHHLTKLNESRTFQVDYENNRFLKDGKPFRYISGAFQYFRVHPAQWRDRMKKVRALGLNAIQIEIPWNLHEPEEGRFNFEGIANLTEFILLAQRYNLYVLLRPGPYSCAEWENGGLPWWLLKYKDIKFRVYDSIFLKKVKNYWHALLNTIKPLLYKNGGPVLMLQIENEYGFFGNDHKYMKWLRDFIWSYIGRDVVLYTVDPPNNDLLSGGTIDGVFPTVDFGPSDDEEVEKFFATQRNFSKGGPYVNSELYPGWFTMWGPSNTHPIYSINQILITLKKMYDMGGSFNIYTTVGGTNFEFWSGSEQEDDPNQPVTTSYEFGAPISENGAITPKYVAIRTFIKSLPDWKQKPKTLPKNNTVIPYGKVHMSRIGHSLISNLKKISYKCKTSQLPYTFEELDHPYGFVLYSTTLKTNGQNLSAENIKDHGYVYINDEFQGYLIHGLYTYKKRSLNLTKILKIGDKLEILVENRGRVTFLTAYDSKGLHPPVTLDGVPIEDWSSCPIDLSKASIHKLAKTTSATDPSNLNLSSPGVYIGYFNASELADTFFYSAGWNKGQLFINGYNMGRYWPMVGPQMTLYVPKPYIKKRNVVVMIDLLGASLDYIEFVDHHIFKFKNTTVSTLE